MNNKLISGCITAVKQAILQLEQILITIEKASNIILRKNLENKKEELNQGYLWHRKARRIKISKDIGTDIIFL